MRAIVCKLCGRTAQPTQATDEGICIYCAQSADAGFSYAREMLALRLGRAFFWEKHDPLAPYRSQILRACI